MLLDCLANMRECFFRENLSCNGTALKRREGLDKNDCTVLCTVTEGCMFFNHNEEKSVCVLLSSTEYPMLDEERLIENKGWIFASTDYTTLNVSKLLLRVFLFDHS